MKPEFKSKEISNKQQIIEMAATVFEGAGHERYKVVKSRHGDVILGASYSMSFVIVYAKENVNVYIKGGI